MLAKEQPLRSSLFYAFAILVAYSAIVGLFYFISPAQFRLLYHASKFVSESAFGFLVIFVLLFVSAFLAGGYATRRLAPYFMKQARAIFTLKARQWTFIIVASLCILGHLSLFIVGRSVLHDIREATTSKQELNTLGTGAPLVLMSFLPLASALAGCILFRENKKQGRPGLAFWVVFAALVACVGLRFLYFERLPLYELLVPMGWAFLQYKRLAFIVRWGLVGAVCVVSGFAFAEYFRSWQDYVRGGVYQNTAGDFAQFIVYRLNGYYITPVNHLGALMELGYGGKAHGLYSSRIVLNAPIVGRAASSVFSGARQALASFALWSEILDASHDLNPEFNLFGMYGFSYMDWGYAGLAVACLMGLLGGVLLALNLYEFTWGRIGFPIFLIGMLESPRLLYWTHERILFSVAGVLLIGLLFRYTSAGDESAA